MSELDDKLAEGKRKLAEDQAMLSCELFTEDVDGEVHASVKVYRYSDELLERQPESGGLLANEVRLGRPAKYPFASAGIGDVFTIDLPLHSAHSTKMYWQRKLGRRFRLSKNGDKKTDVERVA